MVTCTNCGASVRDEASFCTSCGARLNPPADPNTTAAWPAPTDDDASPPAKETNDDSGSLEPNEQREADDDRANDDPGDSSDEFSWSWRSSDDEPATVLDEESGAEIAPGDEPPDEPAPDFTELEILDDAPDSDQAGQDPDPGEPAPDTSDAALAIDDDGEDDETSAETLAALATNWESSSPIPLGSTESATGDTSPTAPLAEADSAANEDEDEGEGTMNDDADEDTVAKAERLIGELRSMIPSLARPKPARPSTSARRSELAAALDEAAREGNWDDLRDVLATARDRPREIDSMIALSGNIDRIAALLDDRNRLAKTAADVAERLRQSNSD